MEPHSASFQAFNEWLSHTGPLSVSQSLTCTFLGIFEVVPFLESSVSKVYECSCVQIYCSFDGPQRWAAVLQNRQLPKMGSMKESALLSVLCYGIAEGQLEIG